VKLQDGIEAEDGIVDMGRGRTVEQIKRSSYIAFLLIEALWGWLFLIRDGKSHSSVVLFLMASLFSYIWIRIVRR
jgi:hypothetical protein